MKILNMIQQPIVMEFVVIISVVVIIAFARLIKTCLDGFILKKRYKPTVIHGHRVKNGVCKTIKNLDLNLVPDILIGKTIKLDRISQAMIGDPEPMYDNKCHIYGHLMDYHDIEFQGSMTEDADECIIVKLYSCCDEDGKLFNTTDKVRF